MIDVLADIGLFYDDFGHRVPVEGRDDIVAMVDETIMLDDSDGVTLRTPASSVIERKDIVTVNGSRYMVMRVTPYGDEEEEKILTLGNAL